MLLTNVSKKEIESNLLLVRIVCQNKYNEAELKVTLP